MPKAAVEHIQAFASRTHDRARPAYGRASVSQPRRCILWGTTNNQEYLRSQTGNRRFWPVQAGEIKLDAFERDVDQLLAEGAHEESKGASIVLPKELWGDAADEQERRREFDPWEDALVDVTRSICSEGAEAEERILTADLLFNELGITKDKQTDYHAKRVAVVMRRLGWQGPKQMRVQSRAGKGFWRSTKEPTT
jgi:predicted P-loop ATPase